MTKNDTYGGLHKATINVNDAGLNLEELDIAGDISLMVKHSNILDFTSLSTKPDEIEEIFLVVHYKMQPVVT